MTFDKNFLAGRQFCYRDPLSYKHVELAEIARVSGDAVHVIRAAGPYPENLNVPAFHDRGAQPVCPDVNVPLPSPRPSVFVLARSNVALSGYRTLIGEDGNYTLDESFTSDAIENEEIGRLGHAEQYRNEMIGFENTERPGVYTFRDEGKRFVEIEEPVICLSSNEAPNFGSFLFRIFPKLVEVAKLDVSLKILVPMYFPALKQFLLLAGISASRLIPQYLDHVYLLRQAIVPSMRNRDVWFDDESIAFYDQLRVRHGTARRDKRIYLSRRDFLRSGFANGRVMLNESELLPELESRGFEIVEPQKFSAIEQVRLFSSASTFLSASGSAFFNAVFCYPGTKMIDIESEPHWVHGHARLFGSRGMNYGIFEGAPSNFDFTTHHMPFTVDIPRLVKRLDSFI